MEHEEQREWQTNCRCGAFENRNSLVVGIISFPSPSEFIWKSCLHVRLTTIDHRDTVATFNIDSLFCRKNKNGKFTTTKSDSTNVSVEANEEEGKKNWSNLCWFLSISPFLRIPISISHYYSFHIYTVQFWSLTAHTVVVARGLMMPCMQCNCIISTLTWIL